MLSVSEMKEVVEMFRVGRDSVNYKKFMQWATPGINK